MNGSSRGERPLRVGLDVTPIVTTHGGLARYTSELWSRLALRDDLELKPFALGRGARRELDRSVQRKRVPLRVLRPLWRSLGWPQTETFTGEIDVAHTLALVAAPARAPRVVTVHDVLPLTHPELYPADAIRRFRAELGAARGAEVVVTTCRAAAAELVRVGGVPAQRVAIAPPGVFTLPDGGARRRPDGPYLLAVGQVTPRKGFDVLARAAARLGGDCPPIVIVGPDWWRAEEVKSAIAGTGVDARFLGSVDDATLASLYRAATIVCHPSRAEGFGMTCLEALAAGAPLLASDLASVRELVDGDAVLVPVGDEDALAGELSALLRDDERRRALAAAGPPRAADYTWERTAGLAVAAYRAAVGG